MPSNAEIRQQITAQIISAIEGGKPLPWRQPWKTSFNAGRPTSVLGGRYYRGINPILLQLHADRLGFTSRWWGTFRQWQERGLSVKKRPDDVLPGQWGATIVFYKPISKTRLDAEGEEFQDRFFVLRTFTVFNADQVNDADLFQVGDESDSIAVPNFEPADELIAATGADIRHGGDRAFYDRLGDYIHVPPKGSFNPPGTYYETVLHELAHWSESRLSWDHQKQGYALGELVAEMASSFLATELRIPQAESVENHAAYLKNWLDAMKGDASFIFKASSQAAKVADYLLSLTSSAVPEAVTTAALHAP